MCYNPPPVRDKPLGASAFVKFVYLNINTLDQLKKHTTQFIYLYINQSTSVHYSHEGRLN